jgi:hypothetical protein
MFGQCQGAATRHLPPQKGRPVDYPCGLFRADLSATLRTKLRGTMPEALYLGLLVKAPNADGDGYEELTLPGYERRLLPTTHLNERHEANAEGVTLSIPAGLPPVFHIGLFDAHGDLCFYGRILHTLSSSQPPTRFEFQPYALRLIRLRPEDAGVLRCRAHG